MRALLLWLTLAIWAPVGICNTEKTIFTAPGPIPLPNDASLDNLYLTPLNPAHPTVRTHVNAAFPSEMEPKGTETWLVLQGLRPSQRYEVRICWLATQPTNFWLYTHTISGAFEDPKLLTALTRYAERRRGQLSHADVQLLQARSLSSDGRTAEQSWLFLQVYAAADYYTLNSTLMKNVPPVFVDVILDPFILNILPRSLVPTVGYIGIIVVIALYLSVVISRFLTEVIGSQPISPATTKKYQ